MADGLKARVRGIGDSVRLRGMYAGEGVGRLHRSGELRSLGVGVLVAVVLTGLFLGGRADRRADEARDRLRDAGRAEASCSSSFSRLELAASDEGEAAYYGGLGSSLCSDYGATVAGVPAEPEPFVPPYFR